MLHDPPIVFLDEPTIGMDVVVKEQTREFLRAQVRDRSRTVLLTTHDMAEVDRLCERVMLINHGRLMFDGTIAQLKADHGGPPQVRVTFSEQVPDPRVAGGRVVSSTGLVAVVEPLEETAPGDIVRALIARYPVATVSVAETDIEELIRDIYLSTADRPVASGQQG
jgi:ABC-2 type transport system ATP-binding protein